MRRRAVRMQATDGANGLLTAPMTDPDRVTDLLVAFRKSGVHLSELSVQKPSLDEVFLAITGHGAHDAADIKDEGATK